MLLRHRSLLFLSQMNRLWAQAISPRKFPRQHKVQGLSNRSLRTKRPARRAEIGSKALRRRPRRNPSSPLRRRKEGRRFHRAAVMAIRLRPLLSLRRRRRRERVRTPLCPSARLGSQRKRLRLPRPLLAPLDTSVERIKLALALLHPISIFFSNV